MKPGVIKGIGIAATVLGAAASIVSDFVGKQERDTKIAEEVAKAFAEATKKES